MAAGNEITKLIVIDQEFAVRYNLNMTEACMMAYVSNAPIWSTEIIIDGKCFWWVNRSKPIEDMPLVFSRPDTVYRTLKSLADKSLIVYKKVGRKDCVKLTKDGRKWSRSNSEINPSSPQTRKKIRANSEKNPNHEKNDFPVNSEIAETNSEINPTDIYNKLIYNNNILFKMLKNENPCLLDELLEKQPWHDVIQMQLKAQGLVHDYEKDILPVLIEFLKTEYEAGNLNQPIPSIKRKMIPWAKTVIKNGGIKKKSLRPSNENPKPVYLRRIS